MSPRTPNASSVIGAFTSFRMYFSYDTPCFCISELLSSNIPPSSSRLGWNPSPKVIWCQKLRTATRQQYPKFGCHFRYQNNGTRFCHLCASIVHPIQNACVMLELARTNVWMTFFFNLNRVIIQKHDNDKHGNNGPMAQPKYNFYN